MTKCFVCGILKSVLDLQMPERLKIVEFWMKEDVSNPNIEWKKNSSDPSERLSLRINHKEAAVYSATKKNSLKTPLSPTVENLPKGLKKIRKKIRVIDTRSEYEDEEDEDFQYIPDGLEQLNQANSLMNALSEEEKRLLQQQENLHHMEMQRTAGKMEALSAAADMARQAGFSDDGRKAAAKNLQTNMPLENIEEFVVRDILNNKKKGSGKKIPKGKVIQTLRGVKRVKEAGGNKALQGLSLDMLMKVGEKDLSDEELAKIAARENNALAKKILEKSGQNIKSRRRKKVKLSDKSKEKKGILLRRNLSLKNLNDRV